MMEMSQIREHLASPGLDSNIAFELLRSCGHAIRLHGASHPDLLDCVIRAVEKRKLFQEIDPQLGVMVSALCREAGLFPYLEPETTSWQDAIAKEMYRDPTGSKIVFHVEQARIFNELAAGRGVALSAPTSFGKSTLVDAAIRARNPNTVVIVVPTISLLDETRRRLEANFLHTYQIISLSSQVKLKEKVIFIGTQERLADRQDITEIDFLVIDEFYKLDYSRPDPRAMTLNILLARFGPISRQIYMLGPLVDNFAVEGSISGRVSPIQSRYAPVTAEFSNLSDRPDRLAALWEIIQRYSNEPTLIFSGSPPRANALALFLASQKVQPANRGVGRLADWVAENFHPEWPVVDALRKGIGVHHGRVPRSMSQLFVRLFNRGLLKQLICTSSLIEGVNTVAKNVCIFDKTIDGRKHLSSFEFQNIRGRAGRMFQHYVGRIFMFNAAPEEELLKLEIPAFGNLANAPDEMILRLRDVGVPQRFVERRAAIAKDRILSEWVLAKWGKYGIENLEELALAVWTRLEEGEFSLLWNGFGRYGEVREVV